MDKEILKQLAKSDYAKPLIEHMRNVQSTIADVRYGDYSSEARLVAIKAIEELVIAKLIGFKGKIPNNDLDDYR